MDRVQNITHVELNITDHGLLVKEKDKERYIFLTKKSDIKEDILKINIMGKGLCIYLESGKKWKLMDTNK